MGRKTHKRSRPPLKWTVTILAPCHVEKWLTMNIGEEEILQRSKLLSPFAGFYDIGLQGDLDQKLANLFELSGFGSGGANVAGPTGKVFQIAHLKNFSVKEMFWPYGILIQGEIQVACMQDILVWAAEFYSMIKLRNVYDESDQVGQNQNYEMTGTPIMILEGNYALPQFIADREAQIILDARGYLSSAERGRIIIEDPVVIISKRNCISDTLYGDIVLALKTVCAINRLGRELRVQLSKELKTYKIQENSVSESRTKASQSIGQRRKERKERKNDVSIPSGDALFRLQKKSAIVNELSSSALFCTGQQKRIFDFVKQGFHISDLIHEVDYACGLIESVAKLKENDISNRMAAEMHKMDVTLFVTGYIGLILAFFDYISIKAKDLFVVDKISDVAYPMRWLVCAFITVSATSFCIGLVKCYRHYKTLKRATQVKWKRIVFWIGLAVGGMMLVRAIWRTVCFGG